MNTFSTSSMHGPVTPLEVKAEFLAVLLRAGMDDDFGRKFKRDTADMTVFQTETLITLVNARLASGLRRRDLRVMMSQDEAVTIVDRSRLFGSAFSVTRQTFAT